MNSNKIPEPPKPPLTRLVKEGSLGTCPKCHSSEQKKYDFGILSFGKKIGCINPECENYYGRNK